MKAQGKRSVALGTVGETRRKPQRGGPKLSGRLSSGIRAAPLGLPSAMRYSPRAALRLPWAILGSPLWGFRALAPYIRAHGKHHIELASFGPGTWIDAGQQLRYAPAPRKVLRGFPNCQWIDALFEGEAGVVDATPCGCTLSKHSGAMRRRRLRVGA